MAQPHTESIFKSGALALTYQLFTATMLKRVFKKKKKQVNLVLGLPHTVHTFPVPVIFHNYVFCHFSVRSSFPGCHNLLV